MKEQLAYYRLNEGDLVAVAGSKQSDWVVITFDTIQVCMPIKTAHLAHEGLGYCLKWIDRPDIPDVIKQAFNGEE